MSKYKEYLSQLILNRGVSRKLVFADFSNPSLNNLSNWKLSSDKSLGGKSEAFMTQMDSFVRFNGSLDSSLPTQKEVSNLNLGWSVERWRKIEKLGFAGLSRETSFWERKIQGYNTVELELRVHDDREYNFNISQDTFLPFEMFVGTIRVHPNDINEWIIARIKYTDMVLTARGVARKYQRRFKGDGVSAIGFSVGNKQNFGDFKIDIKSITFIKEEEEEKGRKM